MWENGQVICSECTSGYYYNITTKKCVKGDFSDCVEVDKFSNKCVLCDLNKSLIPSVNEVGNKCVKIPDLLINKCLDFNFSMTGNQEIACKECTGNYYPKKLDNKNYSFCVYET